MRETTKNLAHKSSRMSRESGMTLIEIMIVIAIIAGVLALGAPRLFSTRTQMQSAVRKVAVLPREIRSISRLFNRTSRLVVSIDDEEGHYYWVESATGNVLLLSAEDQKELDSLTSLRREEEEQNTPDFAIEKRITKRPVQLPRGLYFESVEYTSKEEAITSGKAYIHFFPQGLAEEAAIHLTDRGNLNWTIVINPLTGRAEAYQRKVSLEELKSE